MRAERRTGPLAALGLLLTLVGCSGSPGFEGYHQTGRLQIEASGAPAWRVMPGDRRVLVIFRSAGSSHADADTEELVVELTPAELAAGRADLGAAGRAVRYQQGKRTLTYASRAVRGVVEVKQSGARLVGEVELTADAPTVDVGGLGRVERRFRFDLEPMSAPTQ